MKRWVAEDKVQALLDEWMAGEYMVGEGIIGLRRLIAMATSDVKEQTPRPVEASAPTLEQRLDRGEQGIPKIPDSPHTRHAEASAPAAPPADELKRIIADPSVSTNASQRLPKTIHGRYLSGETVKDLAEDYGLPEEQIEWGIRIGHLLAAAPDAELRELRVRRERVQGCADAVEEFGIAVADEEILLKKKLRLMSWLSGYRKGLHDNLARIDSAIAAREKELEGRK